MSNNIAIISDIHGNMPALDAVISDIEKKGIKRIFCLGDLVGYYCYFNEVVDKINSMGIDCIMGNHDYAMAYNNGVIERSKTCTKILSWQLENANKNTLEYLKILPEKLLINFANKSILMTHGGLINPIDEYLFDVDDKYFTENKFKYDVLITGHTHLTSYKSFYSGKKWLNPGSVGQSRDFDNRASYMIISESFDVQIVRLEYDFMKVVSEMSKLGFENYIAETLVSGVKIGFYNK